VDLTSGQTFISLAAAAAKSAWGNMLGTSCTELAHEATTFETSAAPALSRPGTLCTETQPICILSLILLAVSPS
jgi:hypothetical protein